MKLLKTLFFFSFLVFLSATLYSQPSKTSHWYSYIGNHTLSEKANLWTEMQYRNYDWVSDLQQLVWRVGYGYNLTPQNTNALMGYAFIYNEPYQKKDGSKGSFSEHRVYQQLITKQQWFKLRFTHRYRIEERFLPHTFQMRFRYMFTATVPFSWSAQLPQKWYVAANQEIYIKDEPVLFDRWRWYGGMGFHVQPHLKLELGFMRQMQESGNRSHILMSVAHSLDFSKKE